MRKRRPSARSTNSAAPPLNIALLTGASYGDPTTFSVFQGLRREFKKLGHSVKIYAPEEPAGRAMRFSLPGTKHIRRFAPSLKEASRALNAFVEKDQIDVLHLHFSGLARSWFPALLKIPETAEVVTTFQDYRHPDLPPNTPAQKRAIADILERSKKATAVSRYLARILRPDFPRVRRKISVVSNGVSTRPRRPSAARRRPFILSVGRYAPYKGFDLLLWAYARARESGLRADLVLAGPPYGRKRYRTLADALGLGAHARLLGLQSPAKIDALRQACLFYATAPRTESFGIAPLEAMAAGKAVLAAAAGGIGEYLKNGVNGLAVPVKDTKLLSKGMRRLAGNPALRRRLGERARKTAAAYGWDRICSEYLAVYRA
jgi:glycosyltransferase involved in cell wall biosynthesis